VVGVVAVLSRGNGAGRAFQSFCPTSPNPQTDTEQCNERPNVSHALTARHAPMQEV